jgi:hypothetical protein
LPGFLRSGVSDSMIRIERIFFGMCQNDRRSEFANLAAKPFYRAAIKLKRFLRHPVLRGDRRR